MKPSDDASTANSRHTRGHYPVGTRHWIFMCFAGAGISLFCTTCAVAAWKSGSPLSALPDILLSLTGAVLVFQAVSAHQAQQVLRHNAVLAQNKLHALYDVSMAIEVRRDLDTQLKAIVSTIQRVVEATSPAAVRLVLGRSEFCSDGFQFSHDKASVPVYANGNESGCIEIYSNAASSQNPSSALSANDRQFLTVMAQKIGIIVERRQNEEAMDNLLAGQQQSQEELQRFFEIGAHHLQEPLRLIASYLQLLEHRYRDKLGSDGREFIDFAVDGAVWMKHLLSDLVRYSSLYQRDIYHEPVDCNKALQMARKNLTAVITRLSATVTCETLPEIMGNEMEITELFQDLIGNGLKFHGTEKPHIHVAARKRFILRYGTGLDASQKKQRHLWFFSVRDNGIGIETQHHTKVFRVFEKLHSRREFVGTGIGLAIARKIVTRHGGQIWIESELGKGTTVFFTIPVYKKHGEQGRT